tara:strand:- start:55 stop:183 length:129 start_codon:yes stop_codon:yes gene_type:complete
MLEDSDPIRLLSLSDMVDLALPVLSRPRFLEVGVRVRASVRV